jgi:hypothetical protein
MAKDVIVDIVPDVVVVVVVVVSWHQKKTKLTWWGPGNNKSTETRS